MPPPRRPRTKQSVWQRRGTYLVLAGAALIVALVSQRILASQVEKAPGAPTGARARQQPGVPAHEAAGAAPEARQPRQRQRPYSGELHLAARDGDVSKVTTLLQEGVPVDVAARDGTHPIHLAADGGNARVVSELLAWGAAVDAKLPADGSTPLLIACERGHAAVAARLLEHGARTEFDHSDSCAECHRIPSALLVAVNFDHANVVIELLRHGVHAEAAAPDAFSPLMIASQLGHARVVKALLTHGVNVDAVKQHDGTSATMLASQMNQPEVLELLLTSGATVDVVSAGDRTALQLASHAGHVAALKVLLARGAAAEHATRRGSRALHFAAQNGHVDAVKVLLTQGRADVHSSNSKGTTALIAAAHNGHLEMVKYLLASSAATDQVTLLNMTATVVSALEGRWAGGDVVKLLLHATMDGCGTTDCAWRHAVHLLFVTIAHGRLDLVSDLSGIARDALQHHAKTNPRAIGDAAHLLLEIVRGDDAATARGLLTTSSHHQGCPYSTAVTPLHLSAALGRIEITRLLLERTDNTNADALWAALYAADAGGHVELVHILHEAVPKGSLGPGVRPPEHALFQRETWTKPAVDGADNSVAEAWLNASVLLGFACGGSRAS